MASNNPWEQAARAKKLRRMVERCDELFAFAGLSRDDGFQAAEFLSNWTAQQWAELAVQVGCNPPSETTIREIIAEYRHRGMRGARAS